MVSPFKKTIAMHIKFYKEKKYGTLLDFCISLESYKHVGLIELTNT